MNFRVGDNVGPYLLLEQIGEGGMGTVFKAYHPSLDRYVALKIINPAYRQDPTFVARFQREARLVAKLEHLNIVPIHDYAEHEKVSYLVMKFIEGKTLKDRLAQGPLTSDEILQVVDSVGSALAYAHTQGILHRDIKPSNVLIGVNGMMYLADFGLARVAHAEVSTLSSESVLGTPHYVSPEQAMGKSDLDRRTDVYSFGVMLYEIVVGQPPFNGNAGFAIIHDHIYSPLPLPSRLNPNISTPVEQVLLKALAKDPNDRFENIAQMVMAFKNAWLDSNSSLHNSLPSATLESSGTAGSAKSLEAIEKSSTGKKERKGWLYILAGIVIGIIIPLSLIPNLRSDLISVLKIASTPTTFVESTPTSQATYTPASSLTSQGTNIATTITPRPANTSAPNTSAPNPTSTARPTVQPTQSVLTLPPVIDTVVNVIDTPAILPSVLP